MRRSSKAWAAGLAAALAANAAWADPGTAISFQGELRDVGIAATGNYDFEVALYGVAENGSAIDTRLFDDVLVDAGQFEVEPDFTEVPFTAGAPYWLEIRVRPGASSGAFTPLLPRQRITPAPYAISAAHVQADGIDAVAIASGAVGAAEIDTAQVQRRVGACAAGMAVQSVAADGTPTCVATGTLTGVTAGTALTGGGSAGNVTLSVANNAIGSTQLADGSIATVDLGPGVVNAAKIDTTQVQRRVASQCTAGSSIRAINPDGTVVCDLQNQSPVPDSSFLAVPGANGATSIVVGEDGLLFLAVHDIDDGRLLGYHCNDPGCNSASLTVLDTGNVGAYPSVTLVNGLPQVAYYDAGNTALKLAVCNDVACTVPVLRTLDNSAQVGEFAQIALTAGGSAAVAYYDRDAGDLKVAACNSFSCNAPLSFVLDNGGGTDVGRNISAFTASGRLVVGYLDVTANRFKLASCAIVSQACLSTFVFNADVAGSGAVSAIGLASSSLPRVFWGRGATLQSATCTDQFCSALEAPVQLAARNFTHLAASRDALGHSIFLGRYTGAFDQAEIWRCTDLDCSAARIGQAFNFGAGVSMDAGVALVLGAHGAPVYSVRNGTESRLRICGNELCNTTMRR